MPVCRSKKCGTGKKETNFFSGKPEYEIMQTAWRERNPGARIKAAKEAIGLNPECATAYILLAEEEVLGDIVVNCEENLKTIIRWDFWEMALLEAFYPYPVIPTVPHVIIF